ncbi:hypothetical protein [Enhygromyxa salina]|uniref:hypothetical protein n=1 Tax=Enhygromyxa salina TaxID=215803 RepID=UPI0006961AE9|nr:hypothetical protein [Enhygromyxa salina]
MRTSAIHEAGHVVVATKLGKYVTQVVLEGDEGETYADWLENSPKFRYQKEAAILIAGMAMERLYFRAIGQHDLASAVTDDVSNNSDIQKLALLVHSKGVDQTQAMANASSTLEKFYMHTLLLALMLDKSHKLTGHQVSQIMSLSGSEVASEMAMFSASTGK